MWRANDFHLALQLTSFYVPLKTILRAKWSRGRKWEWGEEGGFKDGCEEEVYQSTSRMAIINHQLCYFLSGDYLGEVRLRDGREKAKVIGSVQHRQRCAREVVWLLAVRCGCIARVGCLHPAFNSQWSSQQRHQHRRWWTDSAGRVKISISIY